MNVFKKIKDKIEELFQSDCGGMYDMSYERAYNNALCDVEDYIYELEKEYNNCWISVDERLPEKVDDYLVTQYNKNAIDEYCNGYRTSTIFFDDNGWWDDIDSEFGWDIIAWRPLPAPFEPKGE